ncbi:hypothetical protein STEG23_006620 [Scotinomys teguina]
MRSVIWLWPREKPPTGSDLRSVKAVQEILVQKRPKLVSSKLGREKQCSSLGLGCNKLYTSIEAGFDSKAVLRTWEAILEIFSS